MIDRRSKGENVTLIDLTTRRTRTSGFSQHTIFFKPQGDLAVAGGIMNLLLERGTWDKAFVDRHCAFRADTDPPTLEGKAIPFEDFRQRMAFYTPAKVQELAGVSPKELSLLADTVRLVRSDLTIRDDLRDLLVVLLSRPDVQKVVPVLVELLDRKVVTELLTALVTLLDGCGR